MPRKFTRSLRCGRGRTMGLRSRPIGPRNRPRLRDARGALHRMILRISVRQCHREGARNGFRVLLRSAIIVRARFRERWCASGYDERVEKKIRNNCKGGRSALDEGGGRCCCLAGNGSGGCVRWWWWLAAVAVVGGGGGGCSGFRECPRKTSAASHHGEPTEIQ